MLPGGYGELMSPNKMFEYIAMQRPTLCADLPGIRTYLNETETEFFRAGDSADLALRIVRLLREERRRTEIVRGASRLYEKLRWTVASRRYLGAVEGLLAARHDRRAA